MTVNPVKAAESDLAPFVADLDRRLRRLEPTRLAAPGSKFCIYTDHEGGLFKFASGSDPEQVYRDAVWGKGINITRPDEDREPEYVQPAFVALVEVTHNHDFVLGKERF